MIPMVLWIRVFMEHQWLQIRENIVYQDNQSSILLETNGRRSSSKRTRHLNIRYFFVTDQIKKERMTVVFCPTGDMWGDFFTNPLQGAVFYKFRKVILNLED